MERVGARAPAPARRVTVRYRSGDWSVETIRSTPPTIVPLSEPLTDAWTEDRRTGWYEAVDADGRAVYRRPLADPSYEVVDEREGEVLRGRRVARDERVLSLLVPDVGAGARLDVYTPATAEHAAGRARGRPRRVLSAPLPDGASG